MIAERADFGTLGDGGAVGFGRIRGSEKGGLLDRELSDRLAWLAEANRQHPTMLVMLAALRSNDAEMLEFCRAVGPRALTEYGDALRSSRDWHAALVEMLDAAYHRNIATLCRYVDKAA